MEGIEVAEAVAHDGAADEQAAHHVHRVQLEELERVARLRLDVHAHDLGEAGAVVAHRGAPRTAEEV